MHLKINKKMLPWVLLFYLYTFRNVFNRFIGAFQYFDELVAMIALASIVMHAFVKIKKEKYLNYTVVGVLLFVASGLIGSARYKFQPFFSIALPDILLSTKFFLWFGGALILSRRSSPDNIVDCLKKHAKIVSVFLTVLCILDIVFHLFNEMSDYKMGIRAVALYEGATSLASTAGVLLSINLLASKERKTNIFLFLDLFIMAVTLRFKALATVAVVLLIFIFRKYKKKIKTWHYIALGAVAVGVASTQIKTYLIYSTQNARTQLWIKGFEILKDYFPIGTGFGTFASYYSKVHYSPIYSAYGLSGVYGLSIERASFVNDTFWPMVLGQTGFIGLLGYIIALFGIYCCVKRLYKNNNSFYYCGIYIFVYMLISSTSESAFLHWNSMFFAIILGVICNKSMKMGLETRQ